MKQKKQWILLGIVILFGLIQLVRPERNQQTNPSRYDIFHKTDTDARLVSLVQSACYDCHSSRTNYPWYASIAPVSWMISKHVKDGKRHLNFSEWLLYPTDKQLHKLDEIIEVLREDEMPPKPYTLLHNSAKLDVQGKQMIIDWAYELKGKDSATHTP